MRKIENNFAVTGFVGKDAEIRQFTTASVARFSLAIGRSEKNGEENNRVSAFINVEAWRKNEKTDSVENITRFGFDPKKPYVLFVGRITRQKGIIHLVNAIK